MKVTVSITIEEAGKQHESKAVIEMDDDVCGEIIREVATTTANQMAAHARLKHLEARNIRAHELSGR